MKSMRRMFPALLIPAVICTVLVTDNVTAETPTREDSVLASISATIESIDLETRVATLKGALGNLVTFVVDPAVERLDEFSVGDMVAADYYVSVAYELREPSAEERNNPLVFLDAEGKAAGDSPPAGVLVSQVRALCTIEGLDRPTETVTIRGPRGRYAMVRVIDPANLPTMRIGQSVVVTYTESLAISLEKLEAGK